MDFTAGNGQKVSGDVGIQMPEAKVMAADSGIMSGPLQPVSVRTDRLNRRRSDVVAVTLRLACLISSILSLSLMVTAEQSATLSLYGFQLPVYSKWSFSESLEFLVGVSVAVAAYSLLQLLSTAVKLVKKSPVIRSRNNAWIIFIGDQVFAYAMLSGGSAAAGVTNLNHTGIRHSALPDFCKPLHRFCDHVALSITFAFLSFTVLAVSAVLDVLRLSE